MLSRDELERHQVWIYLSAISLGLLLGTAWGYADTLEVLLWPVLGVLLFVTFTQIPLPCCTYLRLSGICAPCLPC